MRVGNEAEERGGIEEEVLESEEVAEGGLEEELVEEELPSSFKHILWNPSEKKKKEVD